MAEDIAQDVMLRLWQMHDELEQFRSVEAIVTLMAKHTLRNLQRRRTAESLEEATIVSLTSSPQEELEAKENEEWEDYRQLFREIKAMKPKRQKRRWAFWGVAAATVAGLLYIAVPTKQVGPQPDGTDLTAKTDTARTMQPRETEMERKSDTVEIMRDEPRPMQSRKRRLRKTEPTINDYAKTYTMMAEG